MYICILYIDIVYIGIFIYFCNTNTNDMKYNINNLLVDGVKYNSNGYFYKDDGDNLKVKRYYMEVIEFIAKRVHELNKIYCAYNNDFTQVGWDYTPIYIKESAINGVINILFNNDISFKDTHDNWVKFKKSDGWVYGKEKNTELKTHPSLVPYEELSEYEKYKDELFKETVLFYQRIFNLIKI